MIVYLFLSFLLCSVSAVQNYQENSFPRIPSKRLIDSKGRIQKGLRYSENIEGNFMVYDASFLAYVWPKLKNGIHLNLRNECWVDVATLMKDLSHSRAWTFNVVDASGRLGSGIKGGNRFWTGSKDLCYELDSQFQSMQQDENKTHHNSRRDDFVEVLSRKENLKDVFIPGKLETWDRHSAQNELKQREISADNTPPFSLAFSSLEIQLNITKPSIYGNYEIIFGICLPASCIREDIVEFIDFSIMINENLKSETKLPRAATITKIRKLEFEYLVYKSSKALLLVIIVALLVALVMFATILDLDLISFLLPRSKSFDLVQPKRPHIVHTTLQKPLKEPVNTSAKEEAPFNLSQNIRFVLPRSFPDPKTCADPADMESVTVNNKNNNNNVKLVTVRRMSKAESLATIALDVVSTVNEKTREGCKKCGRYKKQCVKNITTEDSQERTSPNLSMPYENVSEINSRSSSKWHSVKKVILSFSLTFTLRKVFSSKFRSKNLAAVHGLKVISLFWIVLLHLSVTLVYLSDNGDKDKHPEMYHLIRAATYAFDTLFFVSGLFTTYHYLSLRSHFTTDDLVNFTGIFGEFLQFVCFITNRAIRMLPVYSLTLLMANVFATRNHLMDVVEMPQPDYYNCNCYLWRNLLYINNVFNTDEMCTQWSWYISTDTQFHLIGVLLLTVTGMRMIYVGFLASALLVMGWVSNSVNVYTNMYIFRVLPSNAFSVYEHMTETPWVRLGPYFVGMFSGWILNKTDCQMVTSKITSSVLWVLTVFIIITTSTNFTGSELGVFGEMIFSSLSHTLWSFAMAWIAIASVTGYGGLINRMLSNRYLYPLSRLCYSTYLVHPILIQYALFSSNTAFHLDGMFLFVNYVSFAILSFFCGLLLSVMVETPFANTIRRFMSIDESCSQN